MPGGSKYCYNNKSYSNNHHRNDHRRKDESVDKRRDSRTDSSSKLDDGQQKKKDSLGGGSSNSRSSKADHSPKRESKGHRGKEHDESPKKSSVHNNSSSSRFHRHEQQINPRKSFQQYNNSREHSAKANLQQSSSRNHGHYNSKSSYNNSNNRVHHNRNSPIKSPHFSTRSNSSYNSSNNNTRVHNNRSPIKSPNFNSTRVSGHYNNSNHIKDSQVNSRSKGRYYSPKKSNESNHHHDNSRRIFNERRNCEKDDESHGKRMEHIKTSENQFQGSRKRSISNSEKSSSAAKRCKQEKKTETSVLNANTDTDSSLDDGSSNEDLDNLNVEKWVRSAPEELYYNRTNTGEFNATEVAKKLCRKFEKKLLLKAQNARLEAERLGDSKLEELSKQEALVREQQKEQKHKIHQQKCCHTHVEEHSPEDTNTINANSAATDNNSKIFTTTKVDEVENNQTTQKKKQHQHEEGEICESDCQSSSSIDTDSIKNKCDTGEETTTTKTDSDCKEKKAKKCCHFNDKKLDKNKKKSSNNKSNNKNNDTNCSKNNKNNKQKKVSSSDSSSDSDIDSSSSDDDDDVCGISRSDAANRELEKKKIHPCRLHTELWHNDPGMMNDGPLCRCSAKARRFGIRHGYYPGEETIPMCDPFSTNNTKLVHYRITISPAKNFLVKTPTVINHDGHEYIFEGFSLFSHHKVDLQLPPCKVIRFNIRYDIFVTEEKFPESFCVQELNLFETYLFREILELLDLKYDWTDQKSCPPFHLMPRFVRQLPDNGKEILSMNRVLLHMLKSDKDIIEEDQLSDLFTVKQGDWQDFADKHKGMIVTKFGKKPCAIRVDQIDRDISGQEIEADSGIPYPLLVHFVIRPPQLSYAGNTNYQRAWRRYVKYRHLLSNMAKPSAEEKRKLANKEIKLQEMRTASSMKRDVTVAVSAKGFRTTGIFCDLVQHAMLIPVLVAHLRFHKSLSTLEETMKYEFQNRYLLQLAMTHKSYRENFGTNPDHARNALTNCGIRQPEYGDRRIHYASTRKRGINTLINIMAKFGSDREMESEITHNERLEFLGDAVVEFVTSIHLFHLFPNLEEGGLATYRAAIVQNQHLAVLAQILGLDQYMLYAHGSDLCHDSELRHAMANCFEALMGALFLDGGIEIPDIVFGATLFSQDLEHKSQWVRYPRHPLQIEEPDGDRHWIETHPVLQKLKEFEESIGVVFTHIRLLARAFSDRSLGYNNLSKGSNQRLEILGDTVLQLISSEYLYRHFPDHHEGHLSLLRSSLVNNRTQALVCDDLGMTQYAMRGDPKSEMKTKDRADLLEAVLGALYIDQGLIHCTAFCSICFFPRLNKSITKQEWNDPKSKLQQCCLTLRAMDGKEPDIPVYKVTQSLGPTNTRIYIVAVYFRGERLATANGHSIQEAEMNAAALALEQSGQLFPQLSHQRSVLDKTTNRQKRYR